MSKYHIKALELLANPQLDYRQLVYKIAMVNPKARFVLLNFSGESDSQPDIIENLLLFKVLNTNSLSLMKLFIYLKSKNEC